MIEGPHKDGYLYAKHNLENIDTDELDGFKKLAEHYAAKTGIEMTFELKNQYLLEICHDCQEKI